MEISIYIPFILTVISLVLILGTEMLIFFIWSERESKKEDRKMSSFLRHMHLEGIKNSREVERMIYENHVEAQRMRNKNHEEFQKILSEIQKTNRDNAIYLRRIHEIVDDPET